MTHLAQVDFRIVTVVSGNGHIAGTGIEMTSPLPPTEEYHVSTQLRVLIHYLGRDVCMLIYLFI